DDGTVTLGPAYGKVRIAGMTTEEAASEIRSKLELILARPEVSVQLARGADMELVSSVYPVAIDGTVNLGRYGAVHVAGKTIVETRLAVEKHLEQYFDSPEISVAVDCCNSKFCYVVTESSKLGDNVVRLPVTGKETVLDVISQLGGLSQVSSRKIWIARPAPPDAGKEIVLSVDWLAITRRGSTATNYQIFPGDRIVIAENSEAAAMNSAALLEKGRTLHE
ncbi:MAG: polysaccharide biosynthesis/export family protein, partial [Pirellulales bacterium]|nr:polysaccharide biosynthesis/export family protein [Pirellulales bacterium]